MIRAGKVIGQGGNGCIVSSPENFTHKSIHGSPNYAYKIMHASAAEEEYELSNQLLQIDPEARFGIYIRSIHGPITKQDFDEFLKDQKKTKAFFGLSQKHDLEGRCKEYYDLISKNVDEFSILTMDRYMHDASDKSRINLEFNTRRMFLDAIQNLWYGLKKYHDNNIVHCDIKLPNIAVTANRNTFTYKFCDWGWSKKLDDLDEATNLLGSLLMNSEYASDKIWNNEEELWPDTRPWMPMLIKRSDMQNQFYVVNQLKLNDIFGLLKSTKQLFGFAHRFGILSDFDKEEINKLNIDKGGASKEAYVKDIRHEIMSSILFLNSLDSMRGGLRRSKQLSKSSQKLTKPHRKNSKKY